MEVEEAQVTSFHGELSWGWLVTFCFTQFMSGFRFFPANSSPRNKERERAREETSFGCKDLDATKLPSAVATLSIFFSFSFLYSYILFCFTPLFYFFKVTSSSNAIFLVSKFRNLRCNK